MKTLTVILSVLAIPLGIFFVVYGGADDSPGAQLLGLVMAFLGIVGLARAWKKSRNS